MSGCFWTHNQCVRVPTIYILHSNRVQAQNIYWRLGPSTILLSKKVCEKCKLYCTLEYDMSNAHWASSSQLLRLLQKPEIFQSGQNIGIFWLSGSINQVSALLGSRDPKSLHLLSRIWGASLWIRNSNQARNTTQHSRREKQLTLPEFIKPL